MTHTNLELPSIEELKLQAKRLRSSPLSKDTELSHSGALEQIALLYGYKDWNTLNAVARTAERAEGNERRDISSRYQIGQWVQGAYLGQAFTGEIIGVQTNGPDHFRVVLNLDEAVDVVEFESFSNMRHRITAVVDRYGVSPKKRSDGIPHLRIE